MRSDLYQIALIFLGVVVTALFGVFFYREIFPEYKIYQNDYVALEDFRSTYSGSPPPAFNKGIQQIVMERSDKGPAKIDRCISCHVTMKFNHFSPTKIAKDFNGNILVDEQGFPVKVPNEDYVWGRLNQKVAELTDTKVIQQLTEQGHQGEVNVRLSQAEKLKSLKTAQVGEHVFDVTKVLTMHPLIGRETRPFEYHPMEQYGCTSCHGGNGRGLTTETAHGPVFDGDYEVEYVGEKPQFTEPDAKNDPEFAHVFNAKPGHRLLFQTDPILPGALMQAKCMQCHQSSDASLQSAASNANRVIDQFKSRISELKTSYEKEKEALLSMLLIRKSIEENGLPKVVEDLKKEAEDYRISQAERTKIGEQTKSLLQIAGGANAIQTPIAKERVLNHLRQQIIQIVGSQAISEKLEEQISKSSDSLDTLNQFLQEEEGQVSTGSIFTKLAAVKLENAVEKHVENQELPFSQNSRDALGLITDVDILTHNFHRGEQLFVSQACYACHRIAGLSRGGVGPELTREGESYPWFVKESIVWPQADLKTSTMPNYRMDHEEVQDLMTFLLAQRDDSAIRKGAAYQLAVQEWEGGKKTALEKPITPANVHNLKYAMTVFATEGCAACHRLKGFDSNVGFAIEKDKLVTFEQLQKERDWFRQLVPEMITGSQLTKVLEEHRDEINQRIVENVRQNSILEEIEEKSPNTIESLYTSFKYASRAKNHPFAEIIQNAQSPEERQKVQKEMEDWQQLIHRVLMAYVQEYGLGRLVGPRPNWSGVYRSDEWLMDHFHQPSAHVARSIMPVIPFDDSKFYALTYMLDKLGIRNRDASRREWNQHGFNPQIAYDMLCAQCHGDHLQGNGPVSEWIYPIPKNLRNADFLRNYSRENVIAAITHGVNGTPMPPWGEVATDKSTSDGVPVLTKNEIIQLTDWLFSSLPGGQVIRSTEDIPKWRYEPKDVLEELKREGSQLKAKEPPPSEHAALFEQVFEKGEGLFAALEPGSMITKKANMDVADVFNEIPNLYGGTEKYAYYIKKEYYTPENVEAGRQFFELNCAVCHGKDADGAGLRAGTMVDAKPRMLTNLNWIHSRDDLRLLRSIKYGVPGTSMTPWGDQTSSLQRLQLVMFIRSLTEEQTLRDKLKTTTYESFAKANEIIEQARIQPSLALSELRQKLESIQKDRRQLHRGMAEENTWAEKAAQFYKQQLETQDKIDQIKSLDNLYEHFNLIINDQETLFKNLGSTLILKKVGEPFFAQYLQMIRLLTPEYRISDHTFSFANSEEKTKQAEAIQQELLKEISHQMEDIEKQKRVIEGKIGSPERFEQLEHYNAELSGYNQIKNQLINAFEEALRAQKQELKIYKDIQEKLKTIHFSNEAPKTEKSTQT